MKSSHDPKMQVVLHILSDADFPPLNKAAHDVKSDVCRNGGNTSTQHAYPEAEGRDQKHVMVGLEEYDKASRTGGDMSTSTSMESDGDMGMSMGNGTCIDKRQ